MRKRALLLMAGAVALALAGCSGPAVEVATQEVAVDVVDSVLVTGEVVPALWANLSAQTGGTVLEVAVEPGDEVMAGDVLVRLDHTDAELAVQQAEAALETARAEMALLEAGARLQEMTAAEARAAAAGGMVSQATAQRDELAGGVIEADIAAAEEEVAVAEGAYKAAQLRYDEARSEDALAWVKEETALRLQAAERTLAAMRMQLSYLQDSAGARLREADAAVQAAVAQRGIAQAQVDLLRAGATEQEIAVAGAGVAQAEAALEAAQVALARLDVRAPFSGTVGAADVRAGELVAPGQALVTLGDLATLRVETTDLEEADLAHVELGKRVSVSLDAIPERVFGGTVTHISPMAEPGEGSVHYTVVIELDEIDPAVRWGMTAFVEIELVE